MLRVFHIFTCLLRVSELFPIDTKAFYFYHRTKLKDLQKKTFFLLFFLLRQEIYFNICMSFISIFYYFPCSSISMCFNSDSNFCHI